MLDQDIYIDSQSMSISRKTKRNQVRQKHDDSFGSWDNTAR
jgi:hypothetical protein